MTPRTALRLASLSLIGLALLLIFRTGSIAIALGAAVGNPMALWFQLTFMRLFAMLLTGLGVILLWCAARLSLEQQRSLVTLMSGVLGALAATAVTQQIAIWNSTAGWALAGLLLTTAAACTLSALSFAPRKAQSLKSGA